MTDIKIKPTRHAIENWMLRINSEKPTAKQIKDAVGSSTPAGKKLTSKASRFFSKSKYKESGKTPELEEAFSVLVSHTYDAVLLCKKTEAQEILVVSVASLDLIQKSEKSCKARKLKNGRVKKLKTVKQRKTRIRPYNTLTKPNGLGEEE